MLGLDSTIVDVDVDLDKEDVRLPDGRRLTNELAEKMAREGVAEVRRRNPIPAASPSRATVATRLGCSSGSRNPSVGPPKLKPPPRV